MRMKRIENSITEQLCRAIEGDYLSLVEDQGLPRDAAIDILCQKYAEQNDINPQYIRLCLADR